MCFLVVGRKAGSKTKVVLFVFLGGHIAIRADDTTEALSPRRAPPKQSCSPRGWYCPVPWLGLRRAPVSRTCHTYTNTHVRASCCLLLLWCCCCIAVVSGAAIDATAAIALCSLLINCNENTKEKRTRKAKKAKNSGKVLLPNN